MKPSDFNEDQWVIEQSEPATSRQDMPDKAGTGYENGQSRSNPYASGYGGKVTSAPPAGGSRGGTPPKRTLFVVLLVALGIAAGIFGTLLATGQLQLGRKYKVTVANGTGSGEYRPGETVTIVADVEDGYYFSNWDVEKGNAEIKDVYSEQTSFVTGRDDVIITAVVKAYPVLKEGKEIR